MSNVKQEVDRIINLLSRAMRDGDGADHMHFTLLSMALGALLVTRKLSRPPEKVTELVNELLQQAQQAKKRTPLHLVKQKKTPKE